MTDEQKAQAEKMALEGKSIVYISRELGLEWREVSAPVRSVGALGWQGAKVSMTNRLNRLKKENDPAIREDIVDEVKNLADYIFNRAKDMRQRVDRARKALDV